MLIFLRTILLAIAGVAFALFAGFSAAPQTVTVSQEAPAVTAVEPTNFVDIASTTLALLEKNKTPTTTPPAPKATPLPTKPTETPKPAAPTVVSPVSAPVPIQSVASLNERVRGVIVNILCTTKTSGPLNSISASGVIIDPRGLIVTNAHVGQYFLLKDYPTPDFVECIIRTGSPAAPKYKAELLFLPPSWIADNAQKINQAHPTGNGEHDYAFLRITGTVSNSITLPLAFSYAPMSIDPPVEGEGILAAGYAAGFLGGITVQKDLYASSATTKVGEVYTFGNDTLDLFSLGGTVVSQQGSSGGAAVNSNGILVGVIVTSSDAPETEGRDLRAISTSYIVADFLKESGTPLGTYLSGNTALTASVFSQNIASALTSALVKAIEQ